MFSWQKIFIYSCNIVVWNFKNITKNTHSLNCIQNSYQTEATIAAKNKITNKITPNDTNK